MRLRLASFFVACSILSAADASATEGAECARAHEEGQALRAEKKLRKASDRLLVCADESCPGPIKKDCNQWVAEIQEATPTIAIVARDRLGRDLLDVHVLVDGIEVRKRLDGSVLALDPGRHALRFELAKAAPIEQSIVAHEGEKARRVDVAFAFPPRGETEITRPVPPLAIVAFATGVASAAVGAVFLVKAQNDVAALDALGCKPLCNRDDATAVDRGRLIGGLALGAGGVLITTAIVLFATRPSHEIPLAARLRRPVISF